MSSVLMVDSSQDLRPIIPTLRAAGYNPAVAAVYTSSGGCGAFVATPQYVADLHGLGLAVMPVFNGAAIDAGYPGTAAQADADMNACEAQCVALGVPAGCYVAFDIERLADAALQGAYLARVAARGRASIYGGAMLPYGALMDPAFGVAFDAALQQDLADSERMLFWLASYLGAYTGPALPSWGDAAGPSSVPWSPAHQSQIIAWQFWDHGPGPTDLSLVNLPLPQYGIEGLWLPDGSVGQPVAPAVQPVAPAAPAAPSTGPNVLAAVAALAQAQSGVTAALRALGG